MTEESRKIQVLYNTLIKFVQDHEKEVPDDEKSGNLDVLNFELNRFKEHKLNLLFAGEIKTGKSSLINNIIKEDICTVDSGVCTNTNTFVHYGKEEKITIYFEPDQSGKTQDPMVINRENISDFVSEVQNKNNHKNVRIVDVQIPNDSLKNGLSLLDSPGLGSLNPLHAATTFSIAPQADVIVLVTSAVKELTVDEQDYLKQLLTCSACHYVLHVMTNADCGDPDEVMPHNIAYLEALQNELKFELRSCLVSNTNYAQFREGKIKDIEGNEFGFANLKQYLSEFDQNLQKILISRMISCAEPIINAYLAQTETLLESLENPEIAKKKKDELQTIVDRLSEISEEKDNWQIILSGEISHMKNRIEDKISSKFEDIKTVAKNKLEFDDYIDNPEKLGGVISAEVSTFSASMQRILEEELGKTYNALLDKTGVTMLLKDNPIISSSVPEFTFSKPDVNKMSVYRNEIMTSTFIATSVGAVIGGVVGTFLAPGPGTLAGAKLGAGIAGGIGSVLGPIVGFVRGRKRVDQQKKQKIITMIDKEVASCQKDFSRNIQDVIIDLESQLKIAFKGALKKEIAACQKLKKSIEDSLVSSEQLLSDKKMLTMMLSKSKELSSL